MAVLLVVFLGAVNNVKMTQISDLGNRLATELSDVLMLALAQEPHWHPKADVGACKREF